MGWEQRGTNRYYYKKEREGSKVKSVYVGRGEIAQMVAQIQSSSSLIERYARSMKSTKSVEHEQAQSALDQLTHPDPGGFEIRAGRLTAHTGCLLDAPQGPAESA